MPFPDLANSFEEQVAHAVALVRSERYALAAAVVGRLTGVEPAHISAVLIELDRAHAHNAIAGLEIIRALHVQAPRPRLRLVVDRGPDSPLA